MSNQKPVTYDTCVATAVLDRITELAQALDPPVPVAFEDLTADPGKMPRIMLAPLASDAAERRYVSGEAIEAFPFAATLRIAVECEQDGLDAFQFLKDLASAWEAEELEIPGYSVFRKKPLTIPTRLGSTERFEDWQVTMELKYKKIL